MKFIRVITKALLRRTREILSIVFPYLFSVHRKKYFISDELKIIYVPISKSANSYVKSMIISALGLGLDNVEYPQHRSEQVKFLTKRKLPRNSAEYFCFTVVREPEKRLVSGYINKFRDIEKIRKRGFEFSEYCGSIFNLNTTFNQYIDIRNNLPNSARDEHFVDQEYWIYDVHKANARIYSIERIDNLVQDLKYWCGASYNISNDLDIANRSEKNAGSEVFSMTDCACENDKLLVVIGSE